MNLDKKILEDIKRHKYYRSEKEGYIGIFQAAKEFFEEYPYIIEDELKGKEIDTSLVGFIIEDKNTNEKKIIIRKKDQYHFEHLLQCGCIKRACPSLTNGEIIPWVEKYAKPFREKLGALESTLKNCILIKDVDLEEMLYNPHT